MQRIVRLVVVVAMGAMGFYAYWRRHPRTGARFMNEVIDPILVRRTISDSGRAELGTIEHVGRRSGTRRLTPIRPVATADCFRILVPLGLEARWAQNVLAAGHCRMQLGDTVYMLDEPALLLPREMAELPAVWRWLSSRLGFMYLRLHRFAEMPGSLEPAATEPLAQGEIPANQVAADAALPASGGVEERVPETVAAEA